MFHLIYNFGIPYLFKIVIFLQNRSNIHISFPEVRYLFHIITMVFTVVHLRHLVFDVFVFSALQILQFKKIYIILFYLKSDHNPTLQYVYREPKELACDDLVDQWCRNYNSTCKDMYTLFFKSKVMKDAGTCAYFFRSDLWFPSGLMQSWALS